MVTELSIRGRIINISLVFIDKTYFKVSEDIGLNVAHYFIKKIHNKREPQQIALSFIYH